jgi:predicted alpha/beta superfamily hydrolase
MSRRVTTPPQPRAALVATAIGALARATLMGLACSAPAPAAGLEPPPRVGIRGTELRLLDSAIIGERLEIDVSLPRGYEATSERYPVVYVLDAETNFGATSYIAHRLMKNGDIPKVLVVGIAYDTSYDDFYRKRARDLTPVPTQRLPDGGGATRFVRFLAEELFPFVDGHYRSRPGERALYGHSFGGLFADYVLLEYPDLFRRIISISPSIWYADRYLIRKEREVHANGRRPECVLYTAVGEQESAYFVADWKELTATLRSRGYRKLSLKSEVLAGENHRSIFGVAFTNGLRYVFSAGSGRGE